MYKRGAPRRERGEGWDLPGYSKDTDGEDRREDMQQAEESGAEETAS